MSFVTRYTFLRKDTEWFSIYVSDKDSYLKMLVWIQVWVILDELYVQYLSVPNLQRLQISWSDFYHGCVCLAPMRQAVTYVPYYLFDETLKTEIFQPWREKMSNMQRFFSLAETLLKLRYKMGPCVEHYARLEYHNISQSYFRCIYNRSPNLVRMYWLMIFLLQCELIRIHKIHALLIRTPVPCT